MMLSPGAIIRIAAFAGMTLLGGCQPFVDDADREVYRVIERRQQQALGETRDATIDREKVPVSVSADAYQFVPHPITSEVPALAQASATQPAGDFGPPLSTQPASQPSEIAEATTRPASQPVAATQPTREITLEQALDYAFTHSREFQFAKEDLYLQALALSLERHLWTPRLVGNIQSQYANYGQIRNFDHAMAAVAQVGVKQRLPFGGEVAATVINNLMRDLTHHVTSAETGAIILEANIPLLRGAGLPAYESRFQAERDLIYAVRAFENFRRALAVDIAGTYFNLQQLRQEGINARESIKTFEQEAAKARGLWKAGWIIQLEVQRAEQEMAGAASTDVDVQEAYETAVDAFKIRIGMPTEMRIDVTLPDDPTVGVSETQPADELSLEQALQMPEISEEEAVRLALHYRLDLLNDLDRIDDAARGVNVAENNMLPSLTATGSVRMDSHPDELGVFKYNTERTTWRAAVDLELPLDRKAERNVLRTTLIEKRRAERNYQEAKDLVTLQVRRAMRRVVQEEDSLKIQIVNRDLAIQRRKAAQIFFQKGRVSNREVFDAEEELLNARNRLAQAQARSRLSILEFRRDTGTLRIDDEGKWSEPVASPTENR